MGGESTFRSSKPHWAEKIDRDLAINDSDRSSFWAELDTCASSDITECFRQCCVTRQMNGRPSVTLETNETLGSVQCIESVAMDIATQVIAITLSPVPTLTEGEAKLAFERVLDEPNESTALDHFHREFQDYTIRRSDWPNARVFAFRSENPPSCPANEDTPVKIHQRLALPDSDPSECLIIAFSPHDPSLAKRPSCFEAGVYPPSMELFQPQSGEARTSPTSSLLGLREVVIPPPTGRQITRAPRRIT